ncbi:cell wall / vacuolar inhibitor of fructosidase 2-like [Tripterygium wilfordii]|uniref:Cell wall / vacuolar inhibitor of fructosidase 2-like n=1 Tax=Tripterygium wilfordii TaxID=458696 RepID=A0A7J7DZ38_TRIWF|nr:cell wall / vacuolar inhibitor of fructosidase 2-like [Tripterygium wilfordii]KAF5751662.1 cell wall / vacuolar inhibitor of fructosidase 2-like [Tripterygium wilfordii]
MTKIQSFCFLCNLVSIFLVFLITITPSSVATRDVTELVHSVCNQTSNYTFCVESLYKDTRTPHADRYELAYVSFGFAYTNAMDTKDRITGLLRNESTSHEYGLDRLQRCDEDYDKAGPAIEIAFNDLNSETFFTLAGLAGIASDAAADCQVAFEGSGSSPLDSQNKNLKGLCEICVVISKLFTGAR